MGSVSICGLAACKVGRMGGMVLKSLTVPLWTHPPPTTNRFVKGFARFTFA